MTETALHQPVLLQEAIEALQVESDGVYVDGTFGRGGHAQAILDRLGPAGRLYAFDKDPEAVRFGREKFAQDSRLFIVQDSFTKMGPTLSQAGLMGQVRGILLDLGVSSPQLDAAERGFSFQQEGPLDMRMNPQQGVSAAQWLREAPEQEIADVLWEYGEERFSRRIARVIVQARQQQTLETTTQLADLIRKAVPKAEPHKHPATRSFQAIRIYLNRELEDLQAALSQVLSLLGAGGRLAVISFHSLEDRIVKRFIRNPLGTVEPPPGLPVTHAQMQSPLRAVGKAIHAGTAEMERNPRARSAVLRVAEKMVA